MSKSWIPVAVAAIALSLGAGAAQAQYTFALDSAPPSGLAGNPSGGFSTDGNTYGLNWTVPGSVNVYGSGANSSLTFALPAFTLTADAGYVLGGPIKLSVGSFTFTALAGAEIGGSLSGSLSINGGAGIPVSSPLTQTVDVSLPGYKAGSVAFASTTSAAGASTIKFSGGALTLSALAASPGQFANILSQPQNQFTVSFIAAPVPEPESYAMLGVGLFLIGAIVRRRRA